VSLQLENREAEAKTQVYLGNALATLGDVKRCLTLYREAADLHQRLGDVRAKAVTMVKIADILQQRGQTDEALHIHREECIPIFERLGDVRSLVIARAKIGMVLLEEPSPTEADVKEGREHLHCALATAKKHQYAVAAWLREIVQQLLGDVAE